MSLDVLQKVLRKEVAGIIPSEGLVVSPEKGALRRAFASDPVLAVQTERSRGRTASLLSAEISVMVEVFTMLFHGLPIGTADLRILAWFLLTDPKPLDMGLIAERLSVDFEMFRKALSQPNGDTGRKTLSNLIATRVEIVGCEDCQDCRIASECSGKTSPHDSGVCTVARRRCDGIDDGLRKVCEELINPRCSDRLAIAQGMSVQSSSEPRPWLKWNCAKSTGDPFLASQYGADELEDNCTLVDAIVNDMMSAHDSMASIGSVLVPPLVAPAELVRSLSIRDLSNVTERQVVEALEKSPMLEMILTRSAEAVLMEGVNRIWIGLDFLATKPAAVDVPRADSAMPSDEITISVGLDYLEELLKRTASFKGEGKGAKYFMEVKGVRSSGGSGLSIEVLGCFTTGPGICAHAEVRLELSIEEVTRIQAGKEVTTKELVASVRDISSDVVWNLKVLCGTPLRWLDPLLNLGCPFIPWLKDLVTEYADDIIKNQLKGLNDNLGRQEIYPGLTLELASVAVAESSLVVGARLASEGDKVVPAVQWPPKHIVPELVVSVEAQPVNPKALDEGFWRQTDWRDNVDRIVQQYCSATMAEYSTYRCPDSSDSKFFEGCGQWREFAQTYWWDELVVTATASWKDFSPTAVFGWEVGFDPNLEKAGDSKVFRRAFRRPPGLSPTNQEQERQMFTIRGTISEKTFVPFKFTPSSPKGVPIQFQESVVMRVEPEDDACFKNRLQEHFSDWQFHNLPRYIPKDLMRQWKIQPLRVTPGTAGVGTRGEPAGGTR